MNERLRTAEVLAARPLFTPREDHGFAPRGLRRDAAAWYVGVSPSKFDDWVARGLMPGPKQQDGVVVWDRLQLDAAFEALPDRETESDKKPDPYKDIGP